MIRRTMKLLFGTIYSVLVFVAVILSLCVWYFAPYIGGETWRPFDGIFSRVLTIAGIWVFFLLLMGFIFWRRRRQAKAMAEDIVDTVEDSADTVMTEEIGELRSKFNNVYRCSK